MLLFWMPFLKYIGSSWKSLPHQNNRHSKKKVEGGGGNKTNKIWYVFLQKLFFISYHCRIHSGYTCNHLLPKPSSTAQRVDGSPTLRGHKPHSWHFSYNHNQSTFNHQGINKINIMTSTHSFGQLHHTLVQ